MFRVKYLFGILSGMASLLYLGFGILSLRATTLKVFDQLMPFYLCALHTVVAMLLLTSSYRERQREHARLLKVVSALLSQQASITPEQLSNEATISLAEAQEYISQLAEKKKLLVVQKHEHVVIRAFPPHSLN